MDNGQIIVDPVSGPPVTFGWTEDDDYIITGAPTGILGTAVQRVTDEDRPMRDGQVPGPSLLSGKIIAWEGAILGETVAEVELAAVALEEAFRPRDLDATLSVRLSGSPTEWTFFGRVRGVDILLDLMHPQVAGKSAAPIRCAFTATDPVRYGVADSEVVALTAHTIPATLPFVLGLYGEMTAVVGGAVPIDRWTITLQAPSGGPLVNPRILHVGTGQTVRVNRTVPANGTLVLDGYAGRATLSGAAVPTAISQWFSLSPGSNVLRFSADAGSFTASTATIAWRPGWK